MKKLHALLLTTLLASGIGCGQAPQNADVAPKQQLSETAPIKVASLASCFNVSTLAGNGVAGFQDANGLSARFQFPNAVALDDQGSLYVSDTSNHRIRKIAPNGDVTTIAGTGTAGFLDANGTSAQFNSPSGLAVADDGTIYVADVFNNRIRKIAPNGDVTTLAGNSVGGFLDGSGVTARFNNPRGVAVDGDGYVYVADFGNNRIRKIAPNGDVTTLAGSGTFGFQDGSAATARFAVPRGVAVDGSGNVYVADNNNHRIRKIAPDGEVSTLAGSGVQGFQDGSAQTAQFNIPIGIAVDGLGNVYVGDTNNNRIRRIAPNGDVSTLAGSGAIGFLDGDGTTARFNGPSGLAIASDGTIYVADTSGHRIRTVAICQEPPLIDCPAGQVVEATGPAGAVVTFSPTASDPDGGDVALDSLPPSGSTFPLGTTQVKATATDDEGSQAACTFSVTIQDTTAPMLSCPENLTVTTSHPGGAAVSLPSPVASDLVDANPLVEFMNAPAVFPLGVTAVTVKATDDAGNSTTCQFNVTVKLELPIDIKPGSFPNSLNLGAGGKVPVAILSTANFDATQVDLDTVRLAGAPITTKPNGAFQASAGDVDGDGRLDMVIHVSQEALQLSSSATEALLKGKTLAGHDFEGRDSVRIVKP